jgi:hypothetical protein
MDRTRDSLQDMHTHRQALDRDRSAMTAKMQHALSCILKDDVFLNTRVAEEENYRIEMDNAMGMMQREYDESQAQHQDELAPLVDDVKALSTYLEEMQQRTKDLQSYCLKLEGSATTIEHQWLEQVNDMFEGLERASHMDKMKLIVLTSLQQKLASEEYQNAAPRVKAGTLDTVWLASSVVVWEDIVRVVSEERQKMQVRDDSSAMLAETSQRCQKSKALLQAVKSKVEGDGVTRRQLFHEINELHFFLGEKKETEEQMVKYLQDVATQLDEDLSRVLTLVRKGGYDDYVSSSESDGADDDRAAPMMQEEATDDISNLRSSMDLDPSDPNADNVIRAMSHRPDGPLKEFAENWKQHLRTFAQQAAKQGKQPRAGRSSQATLEHAMMQTQVKIADEVIAFVKNRQMSIQQGLTDPKKERMQADPRYIARAKESTSRVERWIQTQKDTPQAAAHLLDDKGASSPARGAAAGKRGALQPIVIEGASVPAEVARADDVAKACFFATNAVRGHRCMLYLRRTMAPQLRHVFLSRDFTKIYARRVGENAQDDVMPINVSDVTDILLGHRTDVFKDIVSLSRHPMRAEAAFSITTSVGTTFDLECDSAQDRTYWASNFAYVVNEMRKGGTLAALGSRVAATDRVNRTRKDDEIADRTVLQVTVTGGL